MDRTKIVAERMAEALGADLHRRERRYGDAFLGHPRRPWVEYVPGCWILCWPSDQALSINIGPSGTCDQESPWEGGVYGDDIHRLTPDSIRQLRRVDAALDGLLSKILAENRRDVGRHSMLAIPSTTAIGAQP